MALDIQYESFGDGCSHTIFFIHSLFSSSKEWMPTLDYIRKERSFHFLLPSIQPNQISQPKQCISDLANLIQTRAKNGKAHIIGLSIGAHIALLLAEHYPELVETLNISGCNSVSTLLKPLLPFGIYIWGKYLTLSRGETPFSLAESQRVTDVMLLSSSVGALPRNTIIVVGLRRGFFSYTSDSVKEAKRLEEALRHTGSTLKVKGGLGMGHRWNLDQPEVYASLILAWIDDSWPERLNKRFVTL